MLPGADLKFATPTEIFMLMPIIFDDLCFSVSIFFPWSKVPSLPSTSFFVHYKHFYAQIFKLGKILPPHKSAARGGPPPLLRHWLHFISQSDITYVAYFSDFLLRPFTALLQKSLHPVLIMKLNV